MDFLLPVLQGMPPGVDPGADPGAFARFLGFQTRIASTLIGTLVVGALLLALAPDFTEGVIDTVEDDPVRSFVYGLVVFVVLLVVLVVLVITIVGILVAIPLALVMVVLYLIGSALVFIYVGERVLEATGTDTSRWGHLLVGAVFAGLLAAVPFVGGLINFVVNAVGVGAVISRWL